MSKINILEEQVDAPNYIAYDVFEVKKENGVQKVFSSREIKKDTVVETGFKRSVSGDRWNVLGPITFCRVVDSPNLKLVENVDKWVLIAAEDIPVGAEITIGEGGKEVY